MPDPIDYDALLTQTKTWANTYTQAGDLIRRLGEAVQRLRADLTAVTGERDALGFATQILQEEVRLRDERIARLKTNAKALLTLMMEDQ